MGRIVANRVQVSPLSREKETWVSSSEEEDFGTSTVVEERVPEFQVQIELVRRLPPFYLLHRIHYTPDFGKSLPEMRFRRHFRFTFRSLEK